MLMESGKNIGKENISLNWNKLKGITLTEG